jgi:hypothetical protein
MVKSIVRRYDSYVADVVMDLALNFKKSVPMADKYIKWINNVSYLAKT